METYFR